MNGACAECGNPIVGRSDKKFCSDQCRYMFNNRQKQDKEKEVLRINSILRKNRTVLKTLSPIGKTTVRKEVLASLNFNFRYFTNIYNTKNMVYYFCYEYGYAYLPDDKALIINWQPYMN